MNDDKLDKILEKLDRIIDLLPKEKSPYSPSYPPLTPGPSFPPYTTCSRCGMRLDRVMGYVCNDSQCPTFLRVTSVTNTGPMWQSMNGEDNK